MKFLNRTAAIGENTANNRFDSSKVISNADGSVLERLETLQQESSPLADFVLIDRDDFDVADVDANTDRWNIGYILGTGSEGGGADINTTTSGKMMVEVDPDATPTEANYGVSLAVPVYGDCWQITVDMDATWGTMGANGCKAGFLINKTTTIDNDQNQLAIFREKSTTVDRIGVGGKLNNAAVTQTNAAITDNALAWKIERWDETYRFYYSLTGSGSYNWVLHTQVEDANNYLTNEIGVFFWVFSKGSTTAETIVGDYDNFKLYAGAGGGGQYISGDYDSSWVTDDVDGNVFERLEALQSDVTAIEVDTTSIISDILVMDSDIMSDLETLKSDLVVLDAIVDTLVTDELTHYTDVESDLTAVEKDTTSIISDILIMDSDIMSDLETLKSDLVVLDAIVDTLVSDELTHYTDLESDLTAIETDTTTIISDILVMDSDIMSDLETIASDLIAFNTALQSDLTSIETDTTAIISDILVMDSDIMSDLETLKSDLVVADEVIDTIETYISDMRASVGIFHEQADATINVTFSDGAVDIFDLNIANTRYLVRDLYLKCTDPGTATITVSLEKLINGTPVVVDTFAINNGNFATYFGLHDMFGTGEIAGDDIHIFVQSGSDVAETVIGQYSHAKTLV